MFDTAQNDQFPSGAAAYAAYIDGSIGNQPNYQSLLAGDFFSATTNPTLTEAELQSGQLATGNGAFTVIPVPPGTAHQIAFGIDNHAQNQPVARLRVAFFDTAWRVHSDVVVDGAKGLGVVAFPNPAETGVVSVRRNDAGQAAVGYVIY